MNSLALLNFLLQSFNPSQNLPLLVFITGASGAGKTHLTTSLESQLDSIHTSAFYFDRIGVPSEEEMIKQYGSGQKWQEAKTREWIDTLLKIRDKKLLILEGQFNPEFAVAHLQKNNRENYLIICLHTERKMREERLINNRKQPELANENMENWANFLKNKTEKLGGSLIETTARSPNRALDEVLKILIESFEKTSYPRMLK